MAGCAERTYIPTPNQVTQELLNKNSPLPNGIWSVRKTLNGVRIEHELPKTVAGKFRTEFTISSHQPPQYKARQYYLLHGCEQEYGPYLNDKLEAKVGWHEVCEDREKNIKSINHQKPPYQQVLEAILKAREEGQLESARQMSYCRETQELNKEPNSVCRYRFEW